LVIAFRARINFLRRKSQDQVSTAFFKDGDPVAYQLLSFTSASSSRPAILSDQAGHLYVTWLEKGDLPGFVVFFASTAPDIREALGGITGRDVGRLSAETLFGLLSGALLIPFVLVWMVVPVVVMGLTSFIRRDDAGFASPGTLVSLTLAVVAYWVGKLVLLPGIWEYVPFSAWLPIIPSWLNFPLRVGVPLILTGLALLAAWHYTYRRQRPSPLYFLLIYVAVDGVLTVAVYGVLFLGSL
jgi:hypothetical protein